MLRVTSILLLAVWAFGDSMAHENKYSGTYIWGPEVNSFKPCDSDIDYWVSFDLPGIKMLEFYNASATIPYQEMYIEFRGMLLNEVVDGFAVEYAGLLRSSEVYKYTFDVPEKCKSNI